MRIARRRGAWVTECASARKTLNQKSGLSFNVKRRLKFGWQHPLHRSSVCGARSPLEYLEDGVMRSFKVTLIAGAALAAAFTSAQAADLGPIMQAPMVQPVQVAESSGWYLRGDIGVGSQQFTSFDHHQTNSAFVWP